MPAGEFEQSAAGLGLKSSAICYSKAAIIHAFIDNKVEEIECVAVDALVGGIVADQFAAMIGRDNNSSSSEAFGSERAFA